MKEINILQFKNYFLDGQSSYVLRLHNKTYQIETTTNLPFRIILVRDGYKTIISGIQRMFLDEVNHVLQVDTVNYFTGLVNSLHFYIEKIFQ